MTPFLTCPRSMPAPDKMISPSRRTRSKTRASAQFREPLALLGVLPPSLLPWPRGAPGSPGRALRHPLVLSHSWALETRLLGWFPGPGFPWRVDRASRSPPRILDSKTRGELPLPPPPRRGCDRPRVAPCPVVFVPRALGGRRIRNQLVKGEGRDLGGSASPTPETGGGPAAAPSSELPPLASLALSGNYPLPPRV